MCTPVHQHTVPTSAKGLPSQGNSDAMLLDLVVPAIEWCVKQNTIWSDLCVVLQVHCEMRLLLAMKEYASSVCPTIIEACDDIA